MEIEHYSVAIDGYEAQVTITGIQKKALKYELATPEFTKATLVFLDEIKHKLVTELSLTATEILDPKVVDILRTRFLKRADELITQDMPSLHKETKQVFIIRILHDMLGLGDMEFLLKDEHLEEIVVNSAKEPIRVYHKRYGWLLTNVTVKTEAEISNFADIIARRVGRQISTLAPLLDAHLITGDRANAVLYPISNKGNTITVRKFARDPWTVTDFITSKTCSAPIFALIWMAIQYEMNILMSGGTASGKTSFLNVILPFIPSNHRVISMEDTRELQLPSFLYWCPLTTRLPNPEGKGQVSMLDLLVNSLRMRPDRIILGEIRRSEEAQVLFEAMHTGHSVYATVHADTLNETITRLLNPPISVAPNLLSAVHLNVVMFRDRRRGIRRVLQVGEFVLGENENNPTVKPNLLYRWKPGTDEIVEHAPSKRLFEELSMHTGFSQQEINKEIAAKEQVLTWMAKQNIRQIEDVGKIIQSYYNDPTEILKHAKKNGTFKTLKLNDG